MPTQQVLRLIDQFIHTIGQLRPEYQASIADWSLNDGHLAVSIISPDGAVFGRLFGDNIKCHRNLFKTAWLKASQVWLTGYPTGCYEELVYTHKIDWMAYGILRPELIGWEGGVPMPIDAETTLSIGVCGFRGETDLEIIERASDLVFADLRQGAARRRVQRVSQGRR